MMQAVFVQLKCALGRAYEVAAGLVDDVAETSEVYSTSGEYDLLAKFYLEEGVDIGRFVTERVQTIPGVSGTFTLITFNAFTRAK
jgi:DNA-binding Lrp family transcriptional regulator